MDDISNKYALAALKERRAAIAGEITSLESRLRYLRQMVEHVDGALRLFSPSLDPGAIPEKKPYRRVKLFASGELNRLILGVLRKAEKPLSSVQITDVVARELGHGPEAKRGMGNRIRANLCYLARERGLVVKEGDRASARWSLKP
ncbi:MAG TPA: hypothetical protein VKA03_00095 [Methylovirgula sp.]|nr:hypothetical protein [Methylovirgula sp.]